MVSHAQEPDHIFMNGVKEFDGREGNHNYLFRNGDNEYQCFVAITGTDGFRGFLRVKKNGEEILMYLVY